MGYWLWEMGDGSVDDNDDNLRPNQYPLGAQMDSNTTQRWEMGYRLWGIGYRLWVMGVRCEM